MFLKHKLKIFFKGKKTPDDNTSYSGESGKEAFIDSLIKENLEGETKPISKASKPKAMNFSKRPLPYVIAGILLFIFLARAFGNMSTISTDAGIKYYEKGKHEDALRVFNKVLEKGNKDVTALHFKGSILNEQEKYYEAIAAFSRAEELHYSDLQFFLDYGYSYFCLEKYDDAIKFFDKAIMIDPSNSEALTWKAYSLFYLNDIKQSKGLLGDAIGYGQSLPFSNNVKGLIASYEKDYETAITLFERVIKDDPEFYDAYLNKVLALYDQRKYSECIEFIDSSLKVFPDDVDLIWYRADCFADQEQYDKALEDYKRASVLDPENGDLLADLGFQYLYLKDYDKAKETANRALEINKDHEYAQYLLEEIEYAKRPEAEKILEFVESNYLYLDKNSSYNEKALSFKNKVNPSPLEVNSFIDSIKNKNDMFSFVVHGQVYDYVKNQEDSSQITTRDMGPGVIYLKIGSFSNNVDYEFKSIVDKIEGTENKILVIDLKDNPGGLGNPTNNILDLLLPECTTSFTIDRKGNMRPYYSGENQIKFKKIIVVVNENSASSAELLTLGLKKYLSNVVVIGKPTLGKGVGQLVYENKEKKYMIFLVSFYWNVKEKNIAGERIIPDIKVTGSSEADYERAIKREISR